MLPFFFLLIQPPEVFYKKSVLKYSAKFTRKHLYQSLIFNEVAGLVCNCIKKRLWHRCFSVNFVKVFKNTCFTEHPRETASFATKLFILYFSGVGYASLKKPEMNLILSFGIIHLVHTQNFAKN